MSVIGGSPPFVSDRLLACIPERGRWTAEVVFNEDIQLGAFGLPSSCISKGRLRFAADQDFFLAA
jgi:hypothetical protein